MSDKLNHISQAYLRDTDLAHRKALGQYFTPKDVREHLLSRLPRMRGASVLDPACGSGEFLLSAGEFFEDCELFGWEIDRKLVNLCREVVPEAKVSRVDSLRRTLDEQFDFVIGNPPYFEFKPDAEVRNRFSRVISGRANIFSMFVQLGLEALKPGGFLAYVIPPSMNNGAYFAGLRDYIIRHADIEYLKILDSSALFDRAQQTVMIMVLKKVDNKGDYVFSRSGLTLFSPDAGRLRDAFEGRTTLDELGFTVRTGRVVWNQHRESLSTKPDGAVPLLWAHNITDDGLSLGNTAKRPQYIKYNRPDCGPAIVVNRVTGAATRVRLKAAVVEPGFQFVAENHVNVIYPPAGKNPYSSVGTLKRICEQIMSASTIEVMKLITGNTQVSRTELAHLLPLDL
ncbi:MAG: N-6 DNA methylase [Candidatus Zixiibacteriota bacterium]